MMDGLFVHQLGESVAVVLRVKLRSFILLAASLLTVLSCSEPLPEVLDSRPEFNYLLVDDNYPTSVSVKAGIKNPQYVSACGVLITSSGLDHVLTVFATLSGDEFFASYNALEPDRDYTITAFLTNGGGLRVYSDSYDIHTLPLPKEEEVEVPQEPGPQTYVDMPDPNFKAWILKEFDKDQDGNLSLGEAAAVDCIDLRGMDITSLKGMEMMPNIISFNVSGYSEKGSLNVDLGDLDLSLYQGLVDVGIHQCHISSLRLGEHRELTVLTVYDCDLKEIDFGKVDGFDGLHLSKNCLERVDVSDLEWLFGMTLNDNPLKELILGDKPWLYDLSLSNTPIEELDLSSCPNLNLLNVDGCANLKTIYLAPGQKIQDIFGAGNVEFKVKEQEQDVKE